MIRNSCVARMFTLREAAHSLGRLNMTHILKSCLLAAALAGISVPTIALAQSSTTPGTGTTTPNADCSDVAADPNCKSNQNQKEQTNPNNPNPEGALNNPAPQAQDPAAENNDQTPGATGNPESASGNNSLNPSGSGGSAGGDNAGGAGSAGSETSN
jgi:hypothetical protein